MAKSAENPASSGASLFIDGIVLPMRLGYGAGERAQEQAVRLDILLRFSEAPAACDTDRLADTLDYGSLVGELHAQLAGQTFHMLERVGRRAADILARKLPAGTGFRVSVSKGQPPLPCPAERVGFTLEGEGRAG